MLTRRNLLRWTIGTAASALVSTESLMRVGVSGIGDAREPKEPGQGLTMEAWMTKWMSGTKAVGGMLNVSRFRERIYFLTAPISWTPNPGQERYKAVNVPSGFVTDFASIPWQFWSVLPPDGEYAYAAVVHDYLYWCQTRSRGEADYILKMAMEDFEVGAVTVGIIYNAVRSPFGQMAWNGNAKKKAQGEKRILSQFPRDPRTKWENWKQRPGVLRSNSEQCGVRTDTIYV